MNVSPTYLLFGLNAVFWAKILYDFEVEKFHQKVKGLTHGFTQFFDKYQTFEITSKYEL